MTRSSGTINGGDALTLLAATHTAIDAHPAWSHVKTIQDVPSVGDERRVYLCSGLFNSIGQDFYISLFYDASDPTKLLGTVHEDFDSVTNNVSRYVPLAQSSSTTLYPIVASNGALGTGNAYSIPNNIDTTTKQNQFFSATSIYVLTNGTTFDYQISVTNDRVIVASNIITPTSGFYLGAYEDYVQIPNNFPIVAVSLTSPDFTPSSGTTRLTQGGFTRHPGRETQPGAREHFHCMGSSNPEAAWTRAKVRSSANNNSDLLLGGASACRIIAGMYNNTSTSALLFGFFRGLLFDVLMVNADATVIPGDTFTYGPTVYDVVARYSATVGTDCVLIEQGV